MTLYNTTTGRINAIEFESGKPAGDTLICIHGFFCDARIFTYFGRKLSVEGYNIVSIDLPGHGKSDGKKGDLNFDGTIKSIHQIIEQVKKRSSGRIFIIAHSMGCIFALWYAHLFRASVDGLILLCPSIRVPKMKKRFDAEPNALKFLILLFARIIVPNKMVDVTEAFPAHVKAGGDELKWMREDPLINFRYTYRFLVNVFAIKNSKVSELSEIGDIPVLILHGRKDKMMYPRVSEEFFKLLNTRMKEIKMFECDHWFYDAIFYDQYFSRYDEESRLQIISSIADWLKSQVVVRMGNQ